MWEIFIQNNLQGSQNSTFGHLEQEIVVSFTGDTIVGLNTGVYF